MNSSPALRRLPLRLEQPTNCNHSPRTLTTCSPVLGEGDAVDAALVPVKLGHVLQGGQPGWRRRLLACMFARHGSVGLGQHEEKGVHCSRCRG